MPVCGINLIIIIIYIIQAINHKHIQAISHVILHTVAGTIYKLQQIQAIGHVILYTLFLGYARVSVPQDVFSRTLLNWLWRTHTGYNPKSMNALYFILFFWLCGVLSTPPV